MVTPAPHHNQQPKPLITLVGPTASGKSHLALQLAERFNAEILSCDSVCVYRGMEIGTAKPSLADRARIPHHLLDLVDPTEPFNAGDWARHARAALADLAARGRLPLIVGGTGLYLRALLDGLFPAPPIDLALRDRLRARNPASLHLLLRRFDPTAANRIHPNDSPKLRRALELVLAAHTPLTTQWQTGGRDALSGYRVLRLALDPPRAELHTRINLRAAGMFDHGLVEETATLLARFAPPTITPPATETALAEAPEIPRALHSLGYAQAVAVLSGSLTLQQAITAAQAGHRQYAKRQLTWFRRDLQRTVLPHFGNDPTALTLATTLIEQHLQAPVPPRFSSDVAAG